LQKKRFHIHPFVDAVAAEQFVAKEPFGRRENVCIQEIHRLPLPLFRKRRPKVSARLRVRADVANDLIGILQITYQHLPVSAAQHGICLFVGPFPERELHQTPHIGYGQRIDLHLVVSQILALAQNVEPFLSVVTTERIVPQTRVDPPSQAVAFRCGIRSGQKPIAPRYGKTVVRADAGYQIAGVDAVLGLCGAVEAHVVHDRGSVPVAADKTGIAQLLGAENAAAPEIMPQSERMPHFVRNHVTDQFAHQRIGQEQIGSPGIDGARLAEIEPLQQVAHRTGDADMTAQNLACTRIGDGGSIGVADGRRFVRYARIAGVVL